MAIVDRKLVPRVFGVQATTQGNFYRVLLILINKGIRVQEVRAVGKDG